MTRAQWCIGPRSPTTLGVCLAVLLRVATYCVFHPRDTVLLSPLFIPVTQTPF